MSASVSIAAGKANREGATSCTERGKKLPQALSIGTGLRRLFPRKTAEEVAFRTGSSVRTARYWLNDAHDMPASKLVEILRSDRGADFLDVIVQAMPRTQWAAFKRKIRDEVRRELLADLARQRDEIDSI